MSAPDYDKPKQPSQLPRILIYGQNHPQTEGMVESLKSCCELVAHASSVQDVAALCRQEIDGVLTLGSATDESGVMWQSAGLLNLIPEGVVLLDAQHRILWCNRHFLKLTGSEASPVGKHFYDPFGTPEILGPDFCPFHSALGSGESARSTLHVGEKSYYAIEAVPLATDGASPSSVLIVLVRDVTFDVLQRQKLNAVYQAGLDLGDLSPQEVLQMSLQDRIELLKAKILHYTKDLLEFDTVEIRLLDKPTKKLEPLLTVGMNPEAANRVLYAEPQGTGVTGFVAATGKSYLCEDTGNDPLYLPGAPGARSSLTVPLFLHEEILGTFNVESPMSGGFDEHDLQFLELFSREVAVALNTLELLVVEKMSTATASTEMVMQEVAHPVDEILNDTTWILERYIGHEPSVSERLQKILKHTRAIKQLIQKVGETMTPKMANPSFPPRPERPKIRKKRILVVDSDEAVRRAAHELLGRFGCDVETSHSGEDACLMVRSFHYDAVIADIRLPDMNGYECFCRLREIHEHLPVILMTGFGYDAAHSLVKARQAGCKSVLFKPFRLDQLLAEVEKAVAPPAEKPEGQVQKT
ncbi:MAG: response regulator [Planctomycetaceae bacterium]